MSDILVTIVFSDVQHFVNLFTNVDRAFISSRANCRYNTKERMEVAGTTPGPSTPRDEVAP